MIAGLLTRDPAKRLGNLAGHEDDIYRKSFFRPIDFGSLRRKQIEAPWKPDVKDPLDASNFDDWSHLEDKMKTKYPPVKEKYQKYFEGF